MPDLPHVFYENPGFDAELLDAIQSLMVKHRVDGGHGGRALVAAVSMRWESPEDQTTTDYVLTTTDDSRLTLQLLLRGASEFLDAAQPAGQE